MFTHKPESAPGFWFKLYCQRWRISWGHSSQAVTYTGKVVISQKRC